MHILKNGDKKGTLELPPPPPPPPPPAIARDELHIKSIVSNISPNLFNF